MQTPTLGNESDLGHTGQKPPTKSVTQGNELLGWCELRRLAVEMLTSRTAGFLRASWQRGHSSSYSVFCTVLGTLVLPRSG